MLSGAIPPDGSTFGRIFRFTFVLHDLAPVVQNYHVSVVQFDKGLALFEGIVSVP